MKLRLNIFALVLPSCNVHVVLVVTLSLTLFSLHFLTEVTTARLVTVECVVSHEFTDFEEVNKTKCLLKLLVELIVLTSYVNILPEVSLKSLDLLDSNLKTSLVTPRVERIANFRNAITMACSALKLLYQA